MGTYRHILSEIHCFCDDINEQPSYCEFGFGQIGLHCIWNNCKHTAYTDCPNEIIVTGKDGLIHSEKDMIGFGGEMDIDVIDEHVSNQLIDEWHSICRRKIAEAHSEYMAGKDEILKHME